MSLPAIPHPASPAPRPDSADYRQILLSGLPLLDTRAPVEFAKGAFPGAINLPLLDDQERAQVGTCYKQHGQEAAIVLGHRLVSGATKEQRIASWAAFAQAHPEGYLYCFRGGLRSQTVQRWLRDHAGIDYPRILGGYKAMRGFLVEATAQALAQTRLVVVAGLTGTGKTEVIHALGQAIDLEGLAHHRGSSFGKRVLGQPAQIDFENRLAIELVRLSGRGANPIVVEDESRFIGSCTLPIELHQRMQECPVVWLEDPFEQRVDRILRDYVVGQLGEFVTAFGPQQGFDRYAAQLTQSLYNIRKRLGGARHAELEKILSQALARQRSDGDSGQHREWIAVLLREYYDPMYSFQRQTRTPRIVFSGDHQALIGFLRQGLQ